MKFSKLVNQDVFVENQKIARAPCIFNSNLFRFMLLVELRARLIVIHFWDS
jgi:hypothetical protein